MSKVIFTGSDGRFELKGANGSSGLYFPVANDAGMMSSVSPNMGGDCKTGQNSFLLAPVSIENLMNDRLNRNFWCAFEGKGAWSAVGASAEAEAARFCGGDDVTVEGGMLWHKLTVESKKYGLRAESTTFAPAEGSTVEITQTRITNISGEAVTFTPVAAVPMYCRSADNIRDHRHVTTLLGRITTTESGVEVRPTLTFDERGHLKGEHVYGVYGSRGEGEKPAGFYPLVCDFAGEGGTLTCPQAVMCGDVPAVGAGWSGEGLEALGGIAFDKITLAPGESEVFQTVLAIDCAADEYLAASAVEKAFAATEQHWNKLVSIKTTTGSEDFDRWLHWVCIQPVLRRICGCSFMPHHDYGRGGRGWRDLWQDCLALILIEPESVRDILLNNFGGVRADGSNATIIGTKPGEFIADRNNIVRVWMDHGVWPFITTRLYVDQTGDVSLLLERRSYFKDAIAARGEMSDKLWCDEQGSTLRTESGEEYLGTVIEHILTQHVTSYYDVGEHGHIRLRGADWNDALDMAREKGESVAFTAAFAGDLRNIAATLEVLSEKTGETTVEIYEELSWLLSEERTRLVCPKAKRDVLLEYCTKCAHTISGRTVRRDIAELAELLRAMAESMMDRIVETEWVTDGELGWFNSYYDNNAEMVEGVRGDVVRMMLTGQVFTILSGTADDERTALIAKAADKYLFDKESGGYRLNTNFGEDIPPLGRQFGFAYGHKENGAVFSHMAVMYAFALYSRGFVAEGWKALKALFESSMDFDRSRIYPGVPEYFDPRGRGMYNYLTGSASWYLYAIQNQVFGIEGLCGNLAISPKLTAEQFGEDGTASISTVFAGRRLDVTYINKNRLEYGSYGIASVAIDDVVIGESIIAREQITALCADKAHKITVTLE